MENNETWEDILALDIRVKRRLHLTTQELELTINDVKLFNDTNYIDLLELKKLIEIAKFTNSDIETEIGISKSYYSMMLGGKNRKNVRKVPIKYIVAILNAVRKRKIDIAFDKILISK